MHAAAANRYAATAYVGFEARSDSCAGLAFYATAGFESAGGRALTERISEAFAGVDALPPASTAGMRLPVLRETRMTAVVCSVGPVQRVVDAAPAISDAVVAALTAWAAEPMPHSMSPA
jgi:N-acetylmuramoyl-L-alanine amidase